MFVIKREVGTNPPMVMWLTRISPPLWGEREGAVKFRSKGDARRAVASIKIVGAWSVEPA
jgi:hypothetical protein